VIADPVNPNPLDGFVGRGHSLSFVDVTVLAG